VRNGVMTKALNKRQRDFARYYTDPASETRGNQLQSAIRAGYTDKYARRACQCLLDNLRVKTEISRLEAEIAEKMDWNRDKAIGKLAELASWVTKAAMGGNIAGINALTGVFRELNAISGLHSSKVQTEDITPVRELTYDEEAALSEAAELVKLRLTQPRKVG